MSNLSAAQFNMISRGTQAAVEQTRPVLGTVQKVADALGYQLKRERSVNKQYDAAGDLRHTDTTITQGFGSKTKRENADGTSQVLQRGHRSLPGLFGGHTQFNDRFNILRPSRPGQPGTGGQPGPAGPPGPIQPLPIRGPFGPGGVGRGTVPSPQAPPVAPTPPYGTPLPFNRVRPQNLNEPFQGDNSPTQPLPFNGSPQGRSDYGNPFGTP